MEAFHTLQGEGTFQGHSAYFIRLGGCDVGCVWCDVKDSWPAENHPQMEIQTIADNAGKSGAPIAVITGGEPSMYNLTDLTNSLHKAGMRTHVETAGVYPITGSWDWICLSPKKFKKPDPSSYMKADEMKVIVFHPSDLAWAEQEASHVQPTCRLYLQPEWSKEKEMAPLIVDFIKTHPRWRISLQVHKYLNIP